MKIFVPSGDQQAIIDSNSSACILAGPGTGKSATALEISKRVAASIRDKQNVLFISFSNAAVKRLAKASGIKVESNRNLRFMTYHSLAWEIVKSYSRFLGLSKRVSVMDEVEKSILLSEGRIMGSKDEQRAVAMETGKVTFELMIPMALELLNRIPLIGKIESRRFPLIIADEFQDTNRDQWALLQKIGIESRIIVLGDLNQVIYSADFEAAGKMVTEFKEWQKVDEYNFSHKSFRCDSKEILDFAECIIKKEKFVPSNLKQVQIINCHRPQFRSTVASICLRILKNIGEKRVGILTTSAAAAQRLAIDLKLPKEGAAVSTPIYARIPISEASKDAFRCACIGLYEYKQKKSSEALLRAAQTFIAFRGSFSRKVKMTTAEVEKFISEISKAPSRRNIQKPLYELVHVLPSMSILEFEKCFLQAMRKKYSPLVSQIEALGYSLIDSSTNAAIQMEFPLEHYRSSREPKGLFGDVVYQSTIEILSLWKSKGREFDYVIIIFDPRELSKTVSIETEKRLLYVGATRAKEWLGVIFPTGSPGVTLNAVI